MIKELLAKLASVFAGLGLGALLLTLPFRVGFALWVAAFLAFEIRKLWRWTQTVLTEVQS